jgi:hypothetical protein
VLYFAFRTLLNFEWSVLLDNLTYLTFKRRTFETAVARAGRSLFNCPMLICQFLLERFH